MAHPRLERHYRSKVGVGPHLRRRRGPVKHDARPDHIVVALGQAQDRRAICCMDARHLKARIPNGMYGPLETRKLLRSVGLIGVVGRGEVGHYARQLDALQVAQTLGLLQGPFRRQSKPPHSRIQFQVARYDPGLPSRFRSQRLGKLH